MEQLTLQDVVASTGQKSQRPAPRPQIASGGAPRFRMRVSRGFQLALLAMFTACCFLTAWMNQYSYDDVYIVWHNPRVHTLAGWTQIFRQDYWAPMGHHGLYRPLTILSFALEWAASPRNAALPHTANILLHMLTTLLVYALGRRLLSHGAALAAAVWFACVPVHVEVVAGVVGRSELLAAVFMLLAVLLVPKPRALLPRAQWRLRAMAAAALSLLALGSKETAISSVAVAALLLWCERQAEATGEGAAARVCALAKHPVLWAIGLATIAYLPVRARVVGWMASGTPFLNNPLLFLGWATRVRTGLLVAGQYLLALIWPFHLSPDYSYNQIPAVTAWMSARLILPALVFAVLGALLYRARRQAAIVFGAGVALITFLPVANLLFAIGTIRGDRLLYVPSIGLALVLGWLGERAFLLLPANRHTGARALFSGRATVMIAAIAVALMLGYTDARESAYWNDNTALFVMAEQRAPNSALIHWARGLDLTQWGHPVDGENEFRRALQIYPAYAQAWLGLGTALEQRGKMSDALACYQRAFRLSPDQDNFGLLAHAQNYLHHYRDVLTEAAMVPQPLNKHNQKQVAEAQAGLRR